MSTKWYYDSSSRLTFRFRGQLSHRSQLIRCLAKISLESSSENGLSCSCSINRKFSIYIAHHDQCHPRWFDAPRVRVLPIATSRCSLNILHPLSVLHG
ncbi:hypothetical protein RSAG8_08719, partial [Rhizoctonia solani AG-8 WAC10335]